MAGKPVASFDITANDQTKSGITSAKNNVEGLAKSAVASTAKMVAGWGAAFLSVKKLMDVTKTSLNLFAQQEKAQISLAIASKNNPLLNKTAVKGLMDFNRQMTATTEFTSAAIYSQQGFLAAQGRSAEEIKRVMTVAMDWASTGTTTLEGAVKNLSKSYGGFSGELGETVPEIKALTVEQLKAGAAIDIMAQKYAGMASTMAQSTSGIQSSMKKTFDDFYISLGSGLAPVFKAVATTIKPILDKINSWIADNADMIANIFLNLPELATIALDFVKKALQKAFSFKQIIENLKAAGKFIVDVFIAVVKLIASYWVRMGDTIIQIVIALAKAIWTVLSAIGKTVWVPLSVGFEWAVYGIRKLWGGMVEGLGKGIDWLIMNPINWLGKAFHNVVQGISSMLEFIVNGIASLINGVIAPLNDVIYAVKQVTTKGFDTGKWDAKSDTIAPMQKMDIGGSTPWKDLTSSLGKKWEETLAPPKDRDIGAEIALIWKTAGSDLSTTMSKLIDGLDGTWTGFGGDIKDAFVDIFETTTELAGKLAVPWTEAFQEMLPKFKAVLFQKLPFELASQLDKVLEQIGDATPVIDVRSNWDKLVDLMAKVGKDSKQGLANAWNKTLSFFTSLPGGFNKAWQGLKNAFTHPGDVIRKAGDNIAASLGKAREAFAGGILGFIDLFKKKKPTEGEEKKEGGSVIGNVLSWLVNKLLELITATATFQALMTWLNELLLAIVDTAIKPLVDALMPLLNIVLSLVQVLANFLVPIFNMLGTFIQATLPLFLAIGNVLQILGEIFVQLAPIIFVVAQIIAQVLTPIIEALAPIMQLLGIVIGWLMPIFGFLAKVLDAITRPIEFLADLFTWTAEIIKSFAENVGIAMWNITHWLDQKSFKQGPGAFSSDAFTRPLVDMSAYAAPATTLTPLTLDSTVTPPSTVTTSEGAATYGGAKTFNITNTIQTGMIVGEFGMREMVRIFSKLQDDMIAEGTA